MKIFLIFAVFIALAFLPKSLLQAKEKPRFCIDAGYVYVPAGNEKCGVVPSRIFEAVNSKDPLKRLLGCEEGTVACNPYIFGLDCNQEPEANSDTLGCKVVNAKFICATNKDKKDGDSSYLCLQKAREISEDKKKVNPFALASKVRGKYPVEFKQVLEQLGVTEKELLTEFKKLQDSFVHTGYAEKASKIIDEGATK